MAKNNFQVGEELTARVVLDEYCRHLTVKLEGEALEKKIQRDTDSRKKNGWDLSYVEKKERYETTFCNVQLNLKGEKPTEAEAALAKKIYKKKGEGAYIDVKKTNCPRFFVLKGDNIQPVKGLDGKSLEGGQTATAVWKVYETPTSCGPQIGFEGLIFDEEPRLWKPAPSSFGGYSVRHAEGESAEPTETTEPAKTAEAETEAPAATPQGFQW